MPATNAPLILVVAGPGGVGKGTVVARLLTLDPKIWLSRSWTTRPRRPGEPADAYVFVDRATFQERVDQGGFLEWTENPTNHCLYGTPTVEPPPGRDVVFEIDLDGYRQVAARYPDAILVLVVAPSVEQQQARLRARGDDAESVARRVAYGAQEEQRGRELTDHVVVNHEVDQAASDLLAILNAARAGREQPACPETESHKAVPPKTEPPKTVPEESRR